MSSSIEDLLSLLTREAESIVESTRGDEPKVRIAALGQLRAALALKIAFEKGKGPKMPVSEAGTPDSAPERTKSGLDGDIVDDLL